jgi:hypothetical protein
MNSNDFGTNQPVFQKLKSSKLSSINRYITPEDIERRVK